MKAAKGSLPSALDRPDPAIRYYLFHGPDEAGSRALAARLLKGLGNADKFIVVGQAVKSDPATLADEAGAISLFGGKRAIWVEPAGGASMLRIGGVLPVVLEMPPEMLMVICAEAVWLAESVTTAFSVCAPFVYFLLSMLQV